MTGLVLYLAAEERRIGTIGFPDAVVRPTVEVLRQALLVSVPRLRNAAITKRQESLL